MSEQKKSVEELAADQVRFVSGKDVLRRAAAQLRAGLGHEPYDPADLATAGMLEFHAGNSVGYAHALRIAYAVLGLPEPEYVAEVLDESA